MEYLNNSEKHLGLLRKMVANARAIISDQIGLSVGVRKMCRILWQLKPYESVKIAKIHYFEKYDEKTRLIPSGTARLYCSHKAFLRYDQELEAINHNYRMKILEVCFDIIAEYSEKVKLK